MRRLVIAVAASALLLAGCQNSATVRAPSAGGYIGLAGARLEVQQPVAIAAGRARVFLQGGAIARPAGAFDQYRPHCAFEIDSIDHDGVTIVPDTFQIVRVQASLQEVVQARPLQLAGLGPVAVGALDGGASYHEGYHFVLYSERQPDVRRLSCYGAYAQPYDLEPPTLAEIQAALAGYAAIVR
ncbi:MAG: hypothetical protein QNJ91_13735 [Gammaproteobacteria bacterium]|nr:hypothetical protein [Gammaproteobacteria bacterium]